MTIPAPVERRFTLAEANRTLPLVRMIVQDIVELYTDLHRRRERLVALRSRQGHATRGPSDPYEAEVIQMESELEADVERLQRYVDELKQIGVELKDPFTGQVEFRTEMNGREAWLCWQLGEEAINSWHELDAGLDGRRSLLESSASPAAKPEHPAGDVEHN